MAFCKYCGKQLQEGEVCTCPEATAAAQAAAPATETAASEPQTAPAAEAAAAPQAATEAGGASSAGGAAIPSLDTEKIGKMAKGAGKNFLDVFTKPATAGREFVANADMTVSICLIAVQAFLSSIFSLFVIGTINKALTSSWFFDDYKFSGIKAFFLTLIYSLICSAVLALLFCLAAMILKAKLLWKQLVALVAVRSVAVAPIIVVSWILYLINPMWGLVLFYLISTLLAVCFLQETIKGIGEISDNKAIYAVFIVMVVFMVFCVIFFGLAGRLYLPRDLREGMGSLTGLLQNLL